MPHRFHLPDIGAGLEEAEVVEWLVATGDVVVRDQPLVEVLTDKASSELPSPVAGTILRLGASEGEWIRVGALLIEIDDGSDAVFNLLRHTRNHPTSIRMATQHQILQPFPFDDVHHIADMGIEIDGGTHQVRSLADTGKGRRIYPVALST